MRSRIVDLKSALDPVYWTKHAFGFEPDPWQADVLRSRSPRILLNCSRQSGKSTVCALLALWTAIYRPRSLILCLSPTLRQSSELFHIVAGFYNNLEERIDPRAESALKLELKNDSRIISLPGKEETIRGYAGVDLLIVDEAARVPDDLYFTVRPMLAVSRGRLIALSTPYGRRGWFYEEWISDHEWERICITADQCPRITPEFLREEEASMPRRWFRQEYYCEFADSEGQLFSREDIEAVLDENAPWIEL